MVRGLLVHPAKWPSNYSFLKSQNFFLFIIILHFHWLMLCDSHCLHGFRRKVQNYSFKPGDLGSGPFYIQKSKSTTSEHGLLPAYMFCFLFVVVPGLLHLFTAVFICEYSDPWRGQNWRTERKPNCTSWGPTWSRGPLSGQPWCSSCVHWQLEMGQKQNHVKLPGLGCPSTFVAFCL